MRAPGHSLGPLPVLFLISQFERRHGGRRSPRGHPISGEPLFKHSATRARGGEDAVSRAIVSWCFGNRISKGETCFSAWEWLRYSHLAGRDELQRTQGDLEVGSVGLEVEESLSNVLLKLRGVLPRRAVGGDLVQGLAAHLDCWCTNWWLVEVVSRCTARKFWLAIGWARDWGFRALMVGLWEFLPFLPQAEFWAWTGHRQNTGPPALETHLTELEPLHNPGNTKWTFPNHHGFGLRLQTRPRSLHGAVPAPRKSQALDSA